MIGTDAPARHPSASTTTIFALIYFPMYTGFLCERLMTSAERLACPESMSESIDTVLRSAEGQRACRQKYDELLATFPQALQQQIMQGFTEPFDRETANALRSEFEKNRPAEQSRFAALVRLAAAAGIAKLNGNEQKSYARTAWTETGLPQNPVSVQIGCPNCTKPALALVSLLEQRYGRREWHLKCPHCRFEDIQQDVPEVGDPEKPIAEEALRNWLSRNPAVAGAWNASKSRRGHVLQELQEHVRNLDTLIGQELQSRVNNCRAELAQCRTVAQWRSIHLHTHLWENLQLGVPLSFPQHLTSRYRRSSTETDELIDDIPCSQTSLTTVALEHVAPHWRTAFEARRARLEDAAQKGDTIEATIQAALFVQDCGQHGLAMPLVLEVELPEAVRPRPVMLSRSTAPEERLHNVPIAELAAFLAESLSTSLVAVDEKAIARLLQRFVASRT